MNKPGSVEPYHLPEERLYGLPPERTPGGDCYAALILLHQAARLVPPGLSGVQAAIRIACDGLSAARLAKPPPPVRPLAEPIEEEERRSLG